MVPWDKVDRLDAKGTTQLAIASLEPYEGEPAEGQICLRDHLLDKKVLDCDDDEVEVVYDIKLALHHGHLYATDVDCSRAGFLRRLGLRRLASFIRGIAARMDDDTIPWAYVQHLPPSMGSFKGRVKLNVLKEKLPDIHPVDLADILEELDHDHRMAIFNQLGTGHASDTLEEVEPRVQRELVASLPVERTAELVNEMTPAQAADILAVLPDTDTDAILEKVDPVEAVKIGSLIERHDQRILDFASSRYITFPCDTKVSAAIDRFRDAARHSDVVMYIYVTDAANLLLGVVDIKELLQADLEATLADIMTTNIVSLREDDTVAKATRLLARYGFRAIATPAGLSIRNGWRPTRHGLGQPGGNMATMRNARPRHHVVGGLLP